MNIATTWTRMVTSKYRYLVMFLTFTLGTVLMGLLGMVTNWWLMIGVSLLSGVLAAIHTWWLDKHPELRRSNRH